VIVEAADMFAVLSDIGSYDNMRINCLLMNEVRIHLALLHSWLDTRSLA